MTGARIRRVVITGELLEQMLRTGVRQPTQIIEGLPEGARFISAGTLGERRLVLHFEHESFDLWTPAAGAAPELPIVVGAADAPLRIAPDDVLVIRYPSRLSEEALARVRRTLEGGLEHHFGFKVRALVLEEGAQLGALLRSNGSR